MIKGNEQDCICQKHYKSHSQGLPEHLDKSVRDTEENIAKPKINQYESSGRSGNSSVPYTPLTKDKCNTMCDCGESIGNYHNNYKEKHVLSALNGLRQDVTNENIGIQRYKVLELIDKWFKISDNQK